MPSDPFVILGLQKGASQSEILEAYKTKRAYYQQHVFDEGEAGADAARMLELLDTAYQDAMSYTHEAAKIGGGEEGEASAYQEVKAAISAKDFAKAQSLLDDMYYRGGEWHYYQAIIFYEKNWLNESKKQLELAVDLEPENEKYKRSLENMKKKIDGTNAFRQNSSGQNAQDGRNGNAGGQQDYATQRTYQQDQTAAAADGCCTACQCAICADCCCECLGGDLIRCC